jgi:hypothetical protein
MRLFLFQGVRSISSERCESSVGLTQNVLDADNLGINKTVLKIDYRMRSGRSFHTKADKNPVSAHGPPPLEDAAQVGTVSFAHCREPVDGVCRPKIHLEQTAAHVKTQYDEADSLQSYADGEDW